MQEQQLRNVWLKNILFSILERQHFQLHRMEKKQNSVQLLSSYLDEIATLIYIPLHDIVKIYTGQQEPLLSNSYLTIQNINFAKMVIIQLQKTCLTEFNTAYQQCLYFVEHIKSS